MRPNRVAGAQGARRPLGVLFAKRPQRSHDQKDPTATHLKEWLLCKRPRPNQTRPVARPSGAMGLHEPDLAQSVRERMGAIEWHSVQATRCAETRTSV